MNTALMPVPRQQFNDANGVPLAGGKIYTYAAGTSTPLATYTDSAGSAANTNPVVLDAGGFASIWLSAASYKIVAEDALGVTQWTVDNVSSISLAELQGGNSFATFSTTGDVTIGGNLEVDGTITGATLNITGSGTFGGNVGAASLSTTGNAAIGGNLSVTGVTTLGTLHAGATTVSSLNIGAQTLSEYVDSLIPSLTALSGGLVISDVAFVTNWVIFTFGTITGSRTRIAFGSASGVSNGTTIPLPTGFSSANMKAIASISSLSVTPDNGMDNFSCSVTGGVVSVAGSDNSGHSYTPTASWIGIAWALLY
jgi:hypothetical protein